MRQVLSKCWVLQHFLLIKMGEFSFLRGWWILKPMSAEIWLYSGQMNKGSDRKIKGQWRVTVIDNGFVTLKRMIKADLFVNVDDWIRLERGGCSHTKSCEKINSALREETHLLCLRQWYKYTKLICDWSVVSKEDNSKWWRRRYKQQTNLWGVTGSGRKCCTNYNLIQKIVREKGYCNYPSEIWNWSWLRGASRDLEK